MAESNALVNLLSDPATLIGLGVVAVGTAYYMATRPRAQNSSIPLDNQSIELPGGVRISHLCKDEKLMSYRFEDAKTLYESFQRGKKVSNNGRCLGWRPTIEAPYSWLSYNEIEERFLAFGAGLTHLGIAPGQESMIGIYASNCVEWAITEHSCYAYSRVIVALYDTLGQDALTHIINQTEIECIICTSTKVKNVVQQTSTCSTLKIIVVMGDTVSDENKQLAEEAKLEIYSFKEVEEKGQSSPLDLVLPTPDTIATICYTSGTTGLPKGAIITHGNVIANVSGIYHHLEDQFEVLSSDCHISYLPMAHMMERCIHAILLMCGSRIGFFSGDVKTLVSDIQVLKPTLFISVPRLLNRIYDKVHAGLQGSKAKKWLFETAYQSKLNEVKSGIIRRDSIWDWLVFSRVQKLLGGNVRLILSGSAPISEKVRCFYQVTFGCIFVEGYGQTECSSGSTMTLPLDTTCGHVGPPIPVSKVKVVDVPDLNYFAANGEGEVCFQGPHCSQGYYKEPEKTAALIDKDGWTHSGDIGKWLPNGTLKIMDRVKHIFKLAQGEYIAPEKVENISVRSKYIAQMFLYGDSLRSSCVAIIVPDEEVLLAWAASNGRPNVSFEELCLEAEIKKMIFEDLQTSARADGLNSLEIPKAIKLSSEQFTIENDLMTPTFKIKRPAAKTRFMPDIVEMYSQLPA